MIRYLQRMKTRKGFTIVELIVVIAIIGILTAVIVPSLNNERSKIEEARATAKDFYAAVQMVMSKYSVYDGDMSIAYSQNKDLGIMRHYPMMGGNYPYDGGAGITNHEYPAATSMYIMVAARNNIMQTVGIVSRARSREATNPGFYELLQRNASSRNTEFGRLLAGEIEGWISFRDGVYYARVDFIPPTNPDGTINTAEINSETVKVVWSAYLRKELPAATGSAAEYTNNNLFFGSDQKLNSGEVCGTCAPWDSSGWFVGAAGTKLD